MTDQTRHRLTLLLAFAGSLAIVLHLSAGFLDQARAGRMPVFEKSAPDVRDWPGHFYLPVG
jgi:hypothetical protein